MLHPLSRGTELCFVALCSFHRYSELCAVDVYLFHRRTKVVGFTCLKCGARNHKAVNPKSYLQGEWISVTLRLLLRKLYSPILLAGCLAWSSPQILPVRHLHAVMLRNCANTWSHSHALQIPFIQACWYASVAYPQHDLNSCPQRLCSLHPASFAFLCTYSNNVTHA